MTIFQIGNDQKRNYLFLFHQLSQIHMHCAIIQKRNCYLNFVNKLKKMAFKLFLLICGLVFEMKIPQIIEHGQNAPMQLSGVKMNPWDIVFFPFKATNTVILLYRKLLIKLMQTIFWKQKQFQKKRKKGFFRGIFLILMPSLLNMCYGRPRTKMNLTMCIGQIIQKFYPYWKA